jgi:hypothetical protein
MNASKNPSFLRRIALLFSQGFLVFSIVGTMQCAKEKAVFLRVDFSKRPSWNYRVNVRIGGWVQAEGQRHNYAGDLACRLTGTGRHDQPEVLDLHIADAAITGDFLSEAERHNFVQQLEEAPFRLDAREGLLVPLDTTILPILMIGEWDLFRSFARALPTLPGSAATAGTTWERQRDFVFAGLLGTSVGHLFQQFRCDSLWQNKAHETIAAVSWIFTYEIEPEAKDLMLSRFPLKGKGAGAALLNTTGNYLQRIDANLTMASSDSAVAAWKEEVSIKLAK